MKSHGHQVTGSLQVTGSTHVGTVVGGTFQQFDENVVIRTIASNTLILNLTSGSVFDVPLTANINSFQVSGSSGVGKLRGFTLILTADGTPRTVSWGSSVRWASDTAPTLTSTSGSSDVFSFFSKDGGTSWYAFTGAQDI